MVTLLHSAKSPAEEVQKHIAMEVTTLPDEACKEIPINPQPHNKTVRDPVETTSDFSKLNFSGRTCALNI